MIKRKSILIITVLLIIMTIFSIYSPTRIAVEGTENKNEKWIDSGFIDLTLSDDAISDKKIDSIIFKEKLYIASEVPILYEENPDYAVSKIYIQAYDGEKWEKIGEPIITNAMSTLVEQITLCKINEELYIFYSVEGLLEVCKLNLNNNTWIKVASMQDVSTKFEIATNNIDTYITTINHNQTVAKIYEFNGNNFKEIITYKENDGYIGEPKIAILKEKVYISIKEAGKETISLYEYYKEKGQIIEVPDCEISAFTYTMAVVSEKTQDKLYIAAITTNEENMIIYAYDGYSWSQIETGLQFEKHTPNMIVKDGEVYILALVVDGKLQTYVYNKNNNTFFKEGDDVDTSAQEAQAIAYKDNIYTIYIVQATNEIKVKMKGYNKILLRGDINLDGRVNIQDIILGAKALVGMEELTPKQAECGHVTTRYEYFNINDIIRICQYIVGNIDVL